MVFSAQLQEQLSDTAFGSLYLMIFVTLVKDLEDSSI